MLRKWYGVCALILGLAAVCLCGAAGQQQQQMNSFDRDRALVMVREIFSDIRKHYYDPHYHGIDLDAKLRQTEEQMRVAPSFNIALADMAAALDTFNDSHLFFQPPPRPYKLDYGWRMRVIGDQAYILAVRPGTDAVAKGLKPGDRIISLNGFQVNRSTMWKLNYLFNVLSPRQQLQLVLQSSAGEAKTVAVSAQVKQSPAVKELRSDNFWQFFHQYEAERYIYRTRCREAGNLAICKLPNFDLSDSQGADILHKINGHEVAIFDLRGNPGGRVTALEQLLGGIFDHEVKVADRIGRKPMKSELAKPHGKAYDGRLIVLVDSESASAAELLARVVQLEKRGTVIGDRTAGAVMEAEEFGYQYGALLRFTVYGASITIADMVMSDGKSLEHIGVTPDEVLLPTAADLSTGRDPVLAHALALAGAQVSPEAAGKMFPIEWPID